MGGSSRSALHPVVGQCLLFAFVGLFGTASHYVVLAVLVEFLHVPIIVATTSGFVTGALINYGLSRRYVFVSGARHLTVLPKFLTVAGLGALINALVVSWILNHAALHYLISQVLATGTVLIWNFAANAVWTFRTK